MALPLSDVLWIAWKPSAERTCVTLIAMQCEAGTSRPKDVRFSNFLGVAIRIEKMELRIVARRTLYDHSIFNSSSFSSVTSSPLSGKCRVCLSSDLK
jgi:hypothetical protein